MRPLMWLGLVAALAHRWLLSRGSAATRTAGSWDTTMSGGGGQPTLMGALRDLLVDPMVDSVKRQLEVSEDWVAPELARLMRTGRRSTSEPSLPDAVDAAERLEEVASSSRSSSDAGDEAMEVDPGTPSTPGSSGSSSTGTEFFAPPPSGAPPVAEPYSDGKRTSRGEEECRRVLQALLGVPFPSVRPSWLRNPVTGMPLELDCYSSDYGIAVEYHGAQHYHHVPKFHRLREQFREQQYRDHLKRIMCEEHGITLIEVPYTVPLAKIEAFLSQRLAECGALR